MKERKMKKSLLSIAFIIPILLFHLTAFAIIDKPNILVIFGDDIGYPPRQKPASFNLEDVMNDLTRGAQGN
jgi:hypothetical protein